MFAAARLKGLIVSLLITFLVIDNAFSALEELQESAFDPFLSANQFVLVVFKSSQECLPCDKVEEEVEQVAQPELLNNVVEKRFTSDSGIAAKYGVKEPPSIVFFRNGVPALHDGEEELYVFLERAVDVATKDLYEDSFEHLTQASTGATTGDWFVLFYKADCEACQDTLPAFETAGIRMRQKMNFAKVDVVANKKLADRFKIADCPSAIFFRQGKMYRYEPGKFDPRSMVSFVESWYKNVQAQTVPTEPTSFDILTDSIAMYLKQQMNDPNGKWMLLLGAVSIATVILVIIILTCRKKPENNTGRFKYD